MLRYEPTPAHELAEQRIAGALVDAQVNGSHPARPSSALARLAYELGQPGPLHRQDDDAAHFFELAFGEWPAWLAYLQEYRDSLAPADSSFFDTAVREIDRPSATNAAAAVARRQLERCLGPDLPRAALRDVIRVAAAVNLAGLPIDETEANGERALPDGPNLPGACVDVRITAIEHAAFARNRDNRFTVRRRSPSGAASPARPSRSATGSPASPPRRRATAASP